MMRSLFSGVSGLKNHQTRMDVIGNNIANVNTIGFKRSRVIFQDMLSQTLQSAASPSSNRAGSNPIQVGLGMSLASIDVIHTTGSLQPTGKNTDLSIEGEGFFMVGDGDRIYYTRAGNFDLNSESVFSHGGTSLKAKGILADSTGQIDPKGQVVDIDLSAQVNSPANATTKITFAKNLDFRAEICGESDEANYTMNVSVFDSKGDTHLVNVFFSKTDNNTWEVKTTVDGRELAEECGRGTLTFDPITGRLDAANSDIIHLECDVDGADDLNIVLDFANTTEYAGDFTITYTGQDGYEAGYLEEVTVDSNGVLNGSFSNGQSRALAQLTIATFSNPAGLDKIGTNLYAISNNSGVPDQGLPGISGRGIIKPETLEMSNVDLTQEFVEMIITQRGFQANSRVITTSDQILEELVNLRR
jgi:flagellar hook protein FlgE